MAQRYSGSDTTSGCYFVTMLRASTFPAALLACALCTDASAGKLLLPMDLTPSHHLDAYGIAYASIAAGRKVEWLLNYRGGSFLLEDDEAFRREAVRRGVLFEALEEAEVDGIRRQIETSNMEAVTLEKAPR